MLLQSLYFSRLLPNRPLPLSSFDTHGRWQPLTQSARSRWSYGKIGDCEQSTIRVALGIGNWAIGSYCLGSLRQITALFDIPKSGLLIFRGKKSKISRDFQGQIRGKIGRFRRKFWGGNFAKKQSVKNSRFRWIFFRQISLKSINFASIWPALFNVCFNRDNHLLFQQQFAREMSEC